MEVEAGGGKDGVDSVAGAALEVVAAHAVFGLEVTDHRLDRGAALHLAADGLVLVTRRTELTPVVWTAPRGI